MATVQMVYAAIDAAADFTLALDFDNSGLLVGDPNEQVRGVLVALDVTDSVIDEAVSRGANLIVTHHPVIFHAMKRVTSDTLVWKLVRAGISVISAHTNLDIAKGGVNDLLAQKLALNEIEVLELTRTPDGMGRAGVLERGMAPPEFAYYVKRMLDLPAVRYCDGGRVVECVAVCGGSGGSLLDAAVEKGCQALVTGDIKHDVMLDAAHRGVTLIDAGHFGTENLVVPYLADLARSVCGDVQIAVARCGVDSATVI